MSKTLLIFASIAFLLMVTHGDEVRIFLGSGFDYIMYIAGMYWPW